LSVAEKKEILEAMLFMGIDPQKIILANGSGCIPDTVSCMQMASQHNLLACLAAPPCYYKNVRDEGVISFYREVCKRAKHPLLLYHIPQYTGVSLSPEIVKTLLKEFPDVVIGIKESEGNLELTKALAPFCQVFVGKEVQLHEAMRYGAAGGIFGLANLWPEIIAAGTQKEIEEKSHLFEHRPFIAASKKMLWPDACFVRPPL
jgi:4-hydroxy-tetrahydrodipicolinate synthase